MGGFLSVLVGAEASPLLTPSSYLWSLLQMLGALLIVCGLAYLLLRGLRRLGNPGARGGVVRVLERCPLSPRHSLWVVEVGDRCFLLGSSDAPAGLTRLAELDRASLQPSDATTATPSFRDVLLRLRHREGRAPAPEEAPHTSPPGSAGEP